MIIRDIHPFIDVGAYMLIWQCSIHESHNNLTTTVIILENQYLRRLYPFYSDFMAIIIQTFGMYLGKTYIFNDWGGRSPQPNENERNAV